MDEYIRRMMEDNRKARERATSRFRRLADALSEETEQGFRDAIDNVLNEYTDELEAADSGILRQEGSAGTAGGDNSESTDTMGGTAAPEES